MTKVRTWTGLDVHAAKVIACVVDAGATCLRVALDYAETRVQWGRAVAGFQLTQSKLVEIARDATTDATGRCCLAIADQRPTMP